MNLIVNECKPTVYQAIKPTENIFVVAIRPHLYIHGTPAGTVKVQIQDGNGRVVAESNSLTITSLKSLSYAHKYYKFDIYSSLIKDVSYRIAVVCGGGYSFNESAYVGVCHDWDNTKSSLEYTPVSDFEKPLDIEIWQRIEG